EIMEKIARLKRRLGATSAAPISALEEAAVVITTRDIDEAIELLNRFPPKELVLHTADPWSLLTRLEGSGSIQLGAVSPPVLRRQHLVRGGLEPRRHELLDPSHATLPRVVARALQAGVAPLLRLRERVEDVPFPLPGLARHAHHVEVLAQRPQRGHHHRLPCR